jgi:hypothetical protein
MSADSISGSLWKYKRNKLGLFSWKKKWVKADEERLLHWHESTRPKSEFSGAKHGFFLYRSVIEECDLRPYAFRITDEQDGRSMVFAADNMVEYEKWLRVLSKSIETCPDPVLTYTNSLQQLYDKKEYESKAESVKLTQTFTQYKPIVVPSLEEFLMKYFARNLIAGVCLLCFDYHDSYS